MEPIVVEESSAANDSASGRGEMDSRRAASRSIHGSDSSTESSLSFVSSLGSEERDSVSDSDDSMMQERSGESQSSVEGPNSEERQSASSRGGNSRVAAGADVEMFDNFFVQAPQRENAFSSELDDVHAYKSREAGRRRRRECGLKTTELDDVLITKSDHAVKSIPSNKRLETPAEVSSRKEAGYTRQKSFRAGLSRKVFKRCTAMPSSQKLSSGS